MNSFVDYIDWSNTRVIILPCTKNGSVCMNVLNWRGRFGNCRRYSFQRPLQQLPRLLCKPMRHSWLEFRIFLISTAPSILRLYRKLSILLFSPFIPSLDSSKFRDWNNAGSNETKPMMKVKQLAEATKRDYFVEKKWQTDFFTVKNLLKYLLFVIQLARGNEIFFLHIIGKGSRIFVGGK